MTRLERESRLFAAGVSSLATAAGVVFGFAAGLGWPLLPLWLALGYALNRTMTRGYDRRRVVVAREFPEAWRAILRERVGFYAALEPSEQQRFEQEVAAFLAAKRVTGIRLELDDTLRVLAAASAVIPVFGFPEWEYDELGEILIYPSAFDEEFRMGDRDEHGVVGMVGSGAMDRMMILSKPDLLHAFDNTSDRRHVGIHEFAHLIDKADGVVDGVPAAVMEAGEIAAWRSLVTSEMDRLASGDSVLDTYGLTNESEFFAVAAEAYFEGPDALARRHPELYAALSRVFRQDMRSRLKHAIRSAWRPGGRKLGRNAPCPCGSGKKYKHCCLGN